jgi:hypothetical protein
MQRGQASIELLGGLPALLLVAAVVAQLLVVGYTAVLAGDAAEAGALAIARGGVAQQAARDAVPGWARAGVRVRRGVGAIRVEMRPPSMLPWLGRLLRVHATAAVAAPGAVPIVPGLGMP